MNRNSIPQSPSQPRTPASHGSTTAPSRHRAGTESDRSKVPSPLDDSAVQRFRQALDRDGAQADTRTDAESGYGQGGNGTPQATHFTGQAPGHNGSPHGPGLAEGLTPDTRAPDHELAERLSRLVEKMWVRSDGQHHLQEIRLNLKADLLPETTLRITQANGVLNVQFATAAAASYQQLTWGRPHLLNLLQRRPGTDQVAVKVSLVSDRRKTGDEPGTDDSPSRFLAG